VSVFLVTILEGVDWADFLVDRLVVVSGSCCTRIGFIVGKLTEKG
jgi:hypothetical protein